MKPQLVLDIGGVLATNLTPVFWNRLGEQAGGTAEQVYAAYKQTLSAKLWTGEIAENEFWSWIGDQLPSAGRDSARALMLECLSPLPAMDKVAAWSRQADIHVLSNHRSEWVMPLLEPIEGCLTSVTISSDIGMRKPHAGIFEYVGQKLPLGAPVLFVDDSPRNLETAERHGWATLLADENGSWAAGIADRLSGMA